MSSSSTSSRNNNTLYDVKPKQRLVRSDRPLLSLLVVLLLIMMITIDYDSVDHKKQQLQLFLHSLLLRVGQTTLFLASLFVNKKEEKLDHETSHHQHQHLIGDAIEAVTSCLPALTTKVSDHDDDDHMEDDQQHNGDKNDDFKSHHQHQLTETAAVTARKGGRISLGKHLLKQGDALGAVTSCLSALSTKAPDDDNKDYIMDAYICAGEASIKLYYDAIVLLKKEEPWQSITTNTATDITRIEQAKEYFEIAMKLDPTNSSVRAGLGLCLYFIATTTTTATTKNSNKISLLLFEAIQHFTSAATTPNNNNNNDDDDDTSDNHAKQQRSCWYNAALCFIQLQQYSEAIPLLQKAIDHPSSKPTASIHDILMWNTLGVCFIQEGELIDAIYSLTTARLFYCSRVCVAVPVIRESCSLIENTLGVAMELLLDNEQDEKQQQTSTTTALSTSPMQQYSTAINLSNAKNFAALWNNQRFLLDEEELDRASSVILEDSTSTSSLASVSFETNAEEREEHNTIATRRSTSSSSSSSSRPITTNSSSSEQHVVNVSSFTELLVVTLFSLFEQQQQHLALADDLSSYNVWIEISRARAHAGDTLGSIEAAVKALNIATSTTTSTSATNEGHTSIAHASSTAIRAVIDALQHALVLDAEDVTDASLTENKNDNTKKLQDSSSLSLVNNYDNAALVNVTEQLQNLQSELQAQNLKLEQVLQKLQHQHLEVVSSLRENTIATSSRAMLDDFDESMTSNTKDNYMDKNLVFDKNSNICLLEEANGLVHLVPPLEDLKVMPLRVGESNSTTTPTTQFQDAAIEEETKPVSNYSDDEFFVATDHDESRTITKVDVDNDPKKGDVDVVQILESVVLTPKINDTITAADHEPNLEQPTSNSTTALLQNDTTADAQEEKQQHMTPIYPTTTSDDVAANVSEEGSPSHAVDIADNKEVPSPQNPAEETLDLDNNSDNLRTNSNIETVTLSTEKKELDPIFEGKIIELPPLYNAMPRLREEVKLSALEESNMKIADSLLKKENFLQASKQLKKVIKSSSNYLPARLGYANSLEELMGGGKSKNIKTITLAYADAAKVALMQDSRTDYLFSRRGDGGITEAILNRALEYAKRAPKKDRIEIYKSLISAAHTASFAAEMYYELGIELLPTIKDNGEPSSMNANHRAALDAFLAANQYADLITENEGKGHGKSLVELAKISLYTTNDPTQAQLLLNRALACPLLEESDRAEVILLLEKANVVVDNFLEGSTFGANKLDERSDVLKDASQQETTIPKFQDKSTLKAPGLRTLQTTSKGFNRPDKLKI